MRVAAYQLDVPDGEPRAARVERVLSLITEAPPTDLIVLPELWDVGYFAFSSYAVSAESLDEGPIVEIAAAAAARGTAVIAGSVLERSDAGLHNTVVAIDADGTIAGTYRKVHLFAHESEESDLLVAGPGPVVAAVRGARIGIATCFDLRFPGQFAAMRAEAADIFVVPAAWPVARGEHWDVLVAARAIETQTPIVAVNGAGSNGGVELAGRSAVIDARGATLARLGRDPGWMVADIDLEDTTTWRREFPIDGP